MMADGVVADDHRGRWSVDGLVQVLHEGKRSVVTRVVLPSGDAVIRKQVRGPDSGPRLRHEREMLRRLAGLECVPQLIEGGAYDGAADEDAILLVDVGGVALAETLPAQPMGVAELLSLSVGLAEAVAAVHGRGVVHKDINPSNILLSGMPPRPSLIDFGLAMTFAEDRPGFVHEDLIAGTLAYLAPEQSGRTGRPVDHRADLYALGATLYELATGGPPFGTDDPLRLIHDHLVRIPIRPDEVNPALPRVLSDVILRLLEKEPDRRYQSAAGLAYDLVRSRDRLARGMPARFPLGERDFPLRLTAPSRLVGRDAEITTLREAFEDAVTGQCHGVLVSGAPGVGKSSLIDELRPIVAAAGGWFVSGKFDQYREDLESDGVRQALGRLCQLLLAEPESDMPELRLRLREALGSNTKLMAALLPEFALLVGADVRPAPADEQVNRDQLVQMGLDFLYAVTTPTRPVVMMLDDLQWTGAAPIALVDAVLSESERTGLLLVGAYRDVEVEAAHPLAAMLTRWQQPGTTLRQIRLHNLPVADLGALLAEMLRLAPGRAAELAEAVAVRTGGNPYDSLELLNALRREGTLSPGPDGWQWDPAAVRRHLGRTDVVELLNTRIDALPADTRDVLEMMACLGGEVAPDLLATASGRPADVLTGQLLPAIEDGLLVMEQTGSGAVRFRHDRVQQAAFTRLAPQARAELQLALARRLATVTGLRALAAKQYLAAAGLIGDRDERHRVAVLFHRTAAGLRILRPAMAERLLGAAMLLLGTEPADVDAGLLAAVETERQAALFNLGRLEDADEVYHAIERHCPDPLEHVAATCVQIDSLTNRNRAAEAVALGLDLLARLGLPTPAPDEIEEVIGRGLAVLAAWAAGDDKNDDLHRPEMSDPRVLAACSLMNRLMPAAFHHSPAILAWLLVEAQRLWVRHGPCEALVTNLGSAGFVTSASEQDYRTGYSVGRHLIAVSEARGYESGTASGRFAYITVAAHWFEPLEDVVCEARRARGDLLRVGETRPAGIAHDVTTMGMLDCAPTLAALLAEVETGLAFSRRTGHQQVTEFLLPVRQLVRALRGETDAPGCLTDATFDEVAHLAGLAANAPAQVMFHVSLAIVAAVSGNVTRLSEHAAAATGLLPMFPGTYSGVNVHLLQGLGLAQRVAGAALAERAAPLAELDACRAWFATRAVDAPVNFAHLSRFLDAERAWAVGDTLTAVSAFDAALHECRASRRPWHRALIAERAGLFHRACGHEYSGRGLLAEASSGYAAWGALAKTRQLDEQHPWLAGLSAGRTEPRRVSTVETRRSGSISSETIDLLGVLDASQALSSETDLDRIRTRVSEVLSAMTGATAVQLLLRDDQASRWYLPDPTGEPGATVPVEEGAARGLVPMSVVRYAERTREPLVVEDAAHDDRFNRDPYLTGLACCSLMVVPILAQGLPRAMLLLENRLTRGAFTTDRLGAVHLIAGQLAVSVDNALLYASLERKVAERTATRAALVEELEWRNRELEAFSGSVSHDLRGPLQVISSYSEQILEDEQDPLSAESRRRLGRIRAAADRMADLVESLLILARASRGQLRRASLDLTATAWQVIDDVESRNPQHKVSFTVQDAMTADADEGLVRVILENLINNAVKFTRKVELPAVEIGSTSRGFFVRDNGVGFPAEKAAELFRPFARLHSADDFPGTGIGLTTVHRAVERHGGDIWAESEEERGATFWFTLPPAPVVRDRRSQSRAYVKPAAQGDRGRAHPE